MTNKIVKKALLSIINKTTSSEQRNNIQCTARMLGLYFPICDHKGYYNCILDITSEVPKYKLPNIG